MTKRIEDNELTKLAAGGGSVGDPNQNIEIDNVDDTVCVCTPKDEYDGDNTGVWLR